MDTFLEPVEMEFPDWEERGWSGPPGLVYLSSEELDEEIETAGVGRGIREVAPGVVADGGVVRSRLLATLEKMDIRCWWYLRDDFIRDGKDIFKYFGVVEEEVQAGSLDEEGVPLLTRYSRRRIGGHEILFWPKTVKHERELEKAFVPSLETPVPLVRCTAYGPDGFRCTNMSIRGATVCIKHGGRMTSIRKHAKAVIEAARTDIMGAVPTAVETLTNLAMSTTTTDSVRLKAAESILDRAGIKGGIEIDVNHGIQENSATERVMERLKQITNRQSVDEDDVIDVEIVEAELDD